MIHPVIQLLRPVQWAKNVIVFLPMFFGGAVHSARCWCAAGVMFAAFSLMASAVYCLNDLIDVEADRLHPVKRGRPLASGRVGVGTACWLTGLTAAGAAAVCALGLGGACGKPLAVLGAYLLLNLAYCLGLKRVAIIDVFAISLGFVLRVVAGGVACGIWVSPWIVLMTFLLCLFLAFAKRRDDVVIHSRQGIVVRRNVLAYNLEFLNQVLGLLGAVTMVCYVMYTVSPEVEARLGSRHIYISSVFVLAGILRFLQIAIVRCDSGSPTHVLVHDRFIHACVLCWVAMFAFIIYL